MRLVASLLVLLAAAWPAAAQPASPDAPPPAEAAAFVDSAEAVLSRLGLRAAQAAWVQATHITRDTKQISARASEVMTAAGSRFAAAAARFNDTDVSPVVRRKLDFLRTGLTMPAPPSEAKTRRLTELSVNLESAYGTGQWCPGDTNGEATVEAGPLDGSSTCRALCEAAGGRLLAMMAPGRSQPWPDALEALTGSREMDASALLDYYAPLKAWLDAQNGQAAAEEGW